MRGVNNPDIKQNTLALVCQMKSVHLKFNPGNHRPYFPSEFPPLFSELFEDPRDVDTTGKVSFVSKLKLQINGDFDKGKLVLVLLFRSENVAMDYVKLYALYAMLGMETIPAVAANVEYDPHFFGETHANAVKKLGLSDDGKTGAECAKRQSLSICLVTEIFSGTMLSSLPRTARRLTKKRYIQGFIYNFLINKATGLERFYSKNYMVSSTGHMIRISFSHGRSCEPVQTPRAACKYIKKHYREISGFILRIKGFKPGIRGSSAYCKWFDDDLQVENLELGKHRAIYDLCSWIRAT